MIKTQSSPAVLPGAVIGVVRPVQPSTQREIGAKAPSAFGTDQFQVKGGSDRQIHDRLQLPTVKPVVQIKPVQVQPSDIGKSAQDAPMPSGVQTVQVAPPRKSLVDSLPGVGQPC